MQVVTETTTTTEVITTTLEKTVNETVLKVDKATQTYENEFPAQSIVSPGKTGCFIILLYACVSIDYRML